MITHEQAVGRLDDFAGGELSGRERREVHRHLESCAECSAEVAALRSLLDEARFLPREVAPERDLWAGIAPRLQPRAAEMPVIALHPRSAWQPRRWLLAAAATVAVAVGSSLATLALLRPPAEGPITLTTIDAAQAQPAATSAFAAFAPAEVEYRRAVDELATLLATRRDRLAPETVATLERSLGIIDIAIAEARTALEKDPNSRELAQMLSTVYDTKVRMLQQAVEL
ncbi:MAG TPA: zf-HC2 domain-containing protein [Longimicrobiaceae bacterium]|nr:zf-HC2 domain-containing protein [Longimicrobiaceae bacterium]